MKLLSFWLVLLTASFLTACGTKIPKNTPCVISAEDSVLICSDGNKTWEVSYADADGFIAWSPQDVERIISYIRRLESRQR